MWTVLKMICSWLGFEWKNELYASDYFEELYEFAIKLIKKGLAYVDDRQSKQIAAKKGTPTEPGKNSKYRDRSIEENLDLFARMKAGNLKMATGRYVQRLIWRIPIC